MALPLPPNTSRLSCTLQGRRHRDYCQSCDRHRGELESELVMWQEHDDHDNPESTFLMLCEQCNAPSGRRTKSTMIEAHPRLYADVQEHRIYPGIMWLCVDCEFRHEFTCTHPDQKSLGGEGLAITGPESFTAHILASNRSRRRSGFTTFWYPATACAGRKEIENVTR
jgi:hypothetical protein